MMFPFYVLSAIILMIQFNVSTLFQIDYPVYQQIKAIQNETEILSIIDKFGKNQLKSMIKFGPRSGRLGETTASGLSFYVWIMCKYETLNQFTTLKSAMPIILEQNKMFKCNVLRLAFWDQFFKVYFLTQPSDQIIKTDTHFFLYLTVMWELKVMPQTSTFNIILNGLNTNKQIKFPERTIQMLFDDYMIKTPSIHVNIRTYEELMKSFSHNLNVDAADNLWKQFTNQRKFNRIISERFKSEYINIKIKSWNDIIFNNNHGMNAELCALKSIEIVRQVGDIFRNTFDASLFIKGQELFIMAMLVNAMVLEQGVELYDGWWFCLMNKNHNTWMKQSEFSSDLAVNDLVIEIMVSLYRTNSDAVSFNGFLKRIGPTPEIVKRHLKEIGAANMVVGQLKVSGERILEELRQLACQHENNDIIMTV